jgi:hypothetical protein
VGAEDGADGTDGAAAPGEPVAGEHADEAFEDGTDRTTDPGEAPPIERLEQTPTFGTGIVSGLGSAMLGFEQALRSQPPPEVMAVEHRPIRGHSGQGGELVLVFPDDPSLESGQDDEVAEA